MEWQNYVSLFLLGVQTGALGCTVYLAFYTMKRINQHYDTITKGYQELGAAQREWKVIRGIVDAQNDVTPQVRRDYTIN